MTVYIYIIDSKCFDVRAHKMYIYKNWVKISKIENVLIFLLQMCSVFHLLNEPNILYTTFPYQNTTFKCIPDIVLENLLIYKQP